MKPVLLIAILICVIKLGECKEKDHKSRECGTDEEWKECGSECPVTCENMNEKNRNCTRPCVKGCCCKPGYVRNEKKRCIKPDKCPKKCGTDEEWKECGSECPVTCENMNEKNRHCTRPCVKGCCCKPGYVRDEKKRCIKPDKCPKTEPCPNITCNATCPKYETTEPCPKCVCPGTPPNCPEYNNDHCHMTPSTDDKCGTCICDDTECDLSGCEKDCHWEGIGGTCPQCYCPPTPPPTTTTTTVCGEHEVFKEIDPCNNCLGTCHPQDYPQWGCDCEPGYCRTSGNPTDPCVPIDTCHNYY